MLRELHISNLAVIEDARIELSDGLNVFTGQTGAGKSLLLGAFELLLGLRSASNMLRAGSDEGRVSGVFELRDQAMANQISELADQTIESGDGILITRKLHASGRTSVSVNGQPATTAMVRAIGEQLVDIHGQHDHQYLLKPSNQLWLIDSAGELLALREQFAEIAGQLRAMRQRRDDLNTSQSLRDQQIELYEFQADEIDAVEPQEGEYAELQARHDVLANVQKLQKHASTAYAALYDTDGAITERLQLVTQVLSELSEIDPELNELVDTIRTATLSLQDASYELNRYTDRLDFDPNEVGEVEQRLNELNRLIRKYSPQQTDGDDPIRAVLQYREEIRLKLENLRSERRDYGNIEMQISEYAVALDAIGRQLTTARRETADQLLPQIETQLRGLGMNDATLQIEFTTATLDDNLGDKTDRDSVSGFDTVEMMIRPNPGQPARPIRKIASGGELSRVMLALKSVLASHDRISVLVFDEIDANIGGRLGTVIGQRLKQLTHTQHQVLCITHLPQIAAFADRHFKITKSITGKGKTKSTRTTVDTLIGNARIDELAEMLAGTGATKTTLKQARELIAAAE